MQPSKTTSPSGTKPPLRWPAVYTALKEAILSHRLVPGTKLPEDELATIYSVSRTIVRSALQGLAHDRLVKIEPNRGAFVAQPSKKEAREVFEARALIEPRVAALAAEIAKPADVAGLRRHLEDEHEAVRTGNDSKAIILSARFHVAVATIADHSILTEFVTDLVSRSSLIIALYWRRHETTCESHAHHQLVDAIADHQPQKASDLMNSHLVDLLAGLDLTLSDTKPKSLAEMLR
ncbi:GntR family transcriptional regulator [Microvirga brassicacearum]|uniref:GntR family transcriptional regulator n=1 Tax=Microvirga brassicacearum TaxID=2580413 RepID=A0A5N3P3D2_9HYPH|nr:GntR family transcriptional regulator [Microvirga brassicacearum]KAB0264224.1 GntR family transcriptional regulator [Microvirga brassicacearum]